MRRVEGKCGASLVAWEGLESMFLGFGYTHRSYLEKVLNRLSVGLKRNL